MDSLRFPEYQLPSVNEAQDEDHVRIVLADDRSRIIKVIDFFKNMVSKVFLEETLEDYATVIELNEKQDKLDPEFGAAGQALVTNDDEDGYDWKTVEGSYISAFPDSQVVPEDFGGIDAGTTAGDLKGNVFSKMWDDALFPTVLASVTIEKEITVNNITSGTIEIGTPITDTLIAVYNHGVITDGDGITTHIIGGIATNYKFTDFDGVVTNNAVGTDTSNIVLNTHAISGSHRCTVLLTHDAGNFIPKDSKGDDDNHLYDIIAETSEDINTAYYTGRYYVLIGTFDSGTAQPYATDGTKNVLDITQFNEKSLQNDGYQRSVNFVSTRRRCIVAYPATYNDIEIFDFISLGTGDDKISSLVETGSIYRKLESGVYILYKYYTYTTASAGNDTDTITIKV